MQDALHSYTIALRGRPAVVVAVLYICGILLADAVPASGTAVRAAVPAIAALVLTAAVFRKGEVFSVLIALVFLAAGYAKYTADINLVRTAPMHRIAETKGNVLVWGTVADRPQQREDRTRMVVRMDSLFDGTATYRLTRELLVVVRPDARYDSGFPEVEYGDYLLIHGSISLPVGRRNPYEPDFNRYLELNNIHALLYVRGYYNIERMGAGRSNRFMGSVVGPIRTYLSGFIDRNLRGESAHFLRGLLLGDRSRIGDEVRESFIAAGVIHILAVSGLHVGIMTLIVFAVLGFLRVPRTARIAATIACLIVYMHVTGAAPSVVRATVMASIMLAGFVLQRRSDVYNSIAVAALVLLALDARELFKPSFQLSFAAVLSIVYLYPRFRDSVQRRVPSIESGFFRKFFIRLLLVSAAAQIGTLPFTVYYFERVSLIALAVNMFVIPGVFFALAFALAASLLGIFSAFLEQVYGLAAESLLSALLFAVDSVSQLPFASIELHGFGVSHALVFYTAAMSIAHLNEPGRFRVSVITCLAAVNLHLFVHIIEFDPSDRHELLRITMLDVGQGDALFIEFPDGKTMLYDAGPRTERFDAGERTLLPFLKRHGVTYIDAAVISHAHADHYGGLQAVLREVEVGIVYDSGLRPAGAWHRGLVQTIERRGIPYRSLRAGDRIDGFDNVRIYVVHPAPAFLPVTDDSESRNVNNTSVVLKIVYGGFRALLAGDAEREAEYYMTHYYGDFLRSDVVKAGHHGSYTSSTERFIGTVAPSSVLISAGRLNRFDHPADVVIERLRERSVYRTDLHGAVTVRSCGGDYSITTMRQADRPY
jgi:competence protein ComEC